MKRAFPEVKREIKFSDLIGCNDFFIHAAEVCQGEHGVFMLILAEDGDGKFTTTTDIPSIMGLLNLYLRK